MKKTMKQTPKKNQDIKCRKRILPLLLCIALTIAMSLCTTGCNSSSSSGASKGSTETDDHVLGTGSTEFALQVVDQEGNETEFEIHTDKETVGEALLDVGLIAGEESGYGLYVKTVNGITADFDEDGVYWAFYINDEYAQTGVDATAITEGDSYSFKIE